MVEMRPNRIKRKLEKGELATLVQGELTPDLIEFFGPLGFDGVWIEAEHGPNDFAEIRDMTRAADLWGMTSVARVNLNLPGVIYRTLDQGAQAIVVPHVNTAAEAQAVVDASKFYPIGSRGAYVSRQGIGVQDYMQKANSETMNVVLIEDIVAVNNLNEILAVDHIDVFFVAPGDLAQSMGYLGMADQAEVQATVDQAISQIVSAGRVAGALATESNLDRYVQLGALFISTAFPRWLSEGARSYLETLSSIKRSS